MAEPGCLVSEESGHLVDSFLITHDKESVSHLEVEVGIGDKLHTCPDDAGHGNAIQRSDIELSELLSCESGPGDGDFPRNRAAFLRGPFAEWYLKFFAEKYLDSFLMSLRSDYQHIVPFVEHSGRTGSLDHAAVGNPGNHESVAVILDEGSHRHSEQCRIADLVAGPDGISSLIALIVKGFLLLVNIHLEDGLEED